MELWNNLIAVTYFGLAFTNLLQSAIRQIDVKIIHNFFFLKTFLLKGKNFLTFSSKSSKSDVWNSTLNFHNNFVFNLSNNWQIIHNSYDLHQAKSNTEKKLYQNDENRWEFEFFSSNVTQQTAKIIWRFLSVLPLFDVQNKIGVSLICVMFLQFIFILEFSWNFR